jgi:hypothetical protein
MGRSNKPGATPRDKMNKMEKVAPEGQVNPMNEHDLNPEIDCPFRALTLLNV